MVPTDFPGTLQPLSDLGIIFSNDFKQMKSKSSFKPSLAVSDKFAVSNFFNPLLRFMQMFGFLPYQIRNDNGECVYKFSRCSLVSIYSWIAILFSFVGFALWVLNRELGQTWPIYLFKKATDTDGFFQEKELTKSIPSTLKTMDRLFQLGLPLFAYVSMFIMRMRSGHLIEFLRKWSTILDDFYSEFSTYYNIELRVLKSWNRVAIPFLVLAYMVPIIGSNFPSKSLLVSDNIIVNFFFNTGFVGYVVSAFFLTTLCTFYSLKILQIAFREINLGIQHQYKGMNGLVTYENVKSWIKLISQVRRQVETFQKFSSIQELVDLLFTFITILSLTYAAFTLYLENIPGAGSMMQLVVPFVGFGLVRTYTKGSMAEQLAEEEQKIGMTVIAMKVNSNNHDPCKTRLEMKTLCDMIFGQPTQVTFGNVIVLNKKLLLSILSQLASYLVVFLQFKNSST